MKPFWVSDIYDEDGEKTIYVNPLPQKYCTFDCVFCPLEERTAVKTDQSCQFDETDALMAQMQKTLAESKVDTVFINPEGEGLSNKELPKIIALAKAYNCKVKLITNGYILNESEYKELLQACDEVIGELMTVTEEDFQRLQRPIEGYTLKNYIENMANFRKAYKGTFNLSVTLLKNYSDSDYALHFLKEAVDKIKPDHVYIETPAEGKLAEAFEASQDRLSHFEKVLNQ